MEIVRSMLSSNTICKSVASQPENTPARPKLSSIRSHSSQRSYRSSDYLTTPLPATETSPPPFTEPPPYRPAVNDHVSLSHILNGEQHQMKTRIPHARFESRSDPFSSPEPRLSRHHLVISQEIKHFNTPQDGFDANCPIASQPGGSVIRRTSTAPARAASQSSQTAFYFPESNHTNELLQNSSALHDAAGSYQDRRSTNIASQLPEHEFKHFAGIQHPDQTISATGFHLPLEIRLRRASSSAAQRSRRDSLLSSLLMSSVGDAVRGSTDCGPLPKQTELREVMSRKASIAEPVTIHTLIHVCMPEKVPHLANTEIGWRERQVTTNTTMQVVRSRNSVYEVIWEDGQRHDASKNNVSPSSTASVCPALSTMDFTNTKLAAWSWTAKSESVDSDLREDEVTLIPLKTMETSKRVSAKESVQFVEDQSSDSPAVNLDVENVLLGETIVTHRRNSAQAPRGLVPTFQQRSNLLGNRKLSNLPSEDEHFQWHRDSLVLAHKRIFHGSTEQYHDDGGVPQIEPLKHVTWKKLRNGETTKTARKDQSSPPDSMPLLMLSAAGPVGTMDSFSNFQVEMAPEQLHHVPRDNFPVNRNTNSSDGSSDGGVRL